MRVVADLIELYIVIIIVRAVLTWFPMGSSSPWRRVAYVLGAVTDPLLRPIRRVVPPLRTGGMAIDLAPMILLVTLVIIQRLL